MRRVTRIAASALLAAVFAALLDLVAALARGAALGPNGALLYLIAGFGLYATAGLTLAAGEALLASGLPRPLPRPTASGALALFAACAVFCALLYVAQRRLVARLNNPVFAATAAALAGVVALGIFALALRALRRAAARRAGRVVLAFACAGAAAALASVLVRVEWRVLHMGGLFGGVAFLAAQATVWRWLPVRRWMLLVGTTFALGALGFSAARLTAPVSVAAGDQGLLLGPLLGVARALSDRDGDGFSPWFLGGDCDDRRRDVHPGARDVPGNGIDENCAGGDAKPRLEVAPAGRSDWQAVRNLLLVTIDALRADRVGPALTPRLSALGAGGVRFTRVRAQAPNTPRSFPSFLASRYPSQVRWVERFRNYSPIRDDEETVFEALARAGIRNIGIFSHFYFAPERNLGQGFAEWDDAGAKSIAESNTDSAAPRIAARVTDRLRRLAGSSERFALWTHFFEPHSRYVDHPEFPVTLRGVPGLVARYDAEVRFVDLHLGRLLDVLHATGLDRSTAVVVFSDHGEAFGEHRDYFHGQALYEEQIRVPLVLAAPGLPPRVTDLSAMLLDLGPTLCELLGVDVPHRFRGRSLLDAARGRPSPARPAFAELLPAPSWPHEARALVDGDRKIIDRLSDNAVEIYDLATDPGERRNLASTPDVVRAEKAALVRWTEAELDGD
jgi:arylsulfatase A-like enzyme